MKFEINTPFRLFSRYVMSESLQPPRTTAHQDPLSSTIYQSLLKFMSIDSGMLSIHLTIYISTEKRKTYGYKSKKYGQDLDKENSKIPMKEI